MFYDLVDEGFVFSMEEKIWFIYIIKTECEKLYTGITTNVERRFQEHLEVFLGEGNKGAKFFRGHQPKKVVYTEVYLSRSDASKREYQIKSMNKREKNMLCKVGDDNI